MACKVPFQPFDLAETAVAVTCLCHWISNETQGKGECVYQICFASSLPALAMQRGEEENKMLTLVV